jgi:hypothetical protein
VSALPIDRNNDEALFDVWQYYFNADAAYRGPKVEAFIAEHGGLYDVAAAVAVAHSVCPQGYVVVVAEPTNAEVEAALEEFTQDVTSLSSEDPRIAMRAVLMAARNVRER